MHARVYVGEGGEKDRAASRPGPVLIVEDDAACREAVVAALQSVGVAARAAENGKEALRLAGQEPIPCLILLDLNMPVMDGWAFRARQVLDPTIARIPVVILSACDDPQRYARELAAAVGLKKPVETETLLDTIKEHCPEAIAREPGAPPSDTGV